MTAHIKIMAILKARSGRGDDLRALLHGMVPHCRAEPGNLRWDVWQDHSQADRYVLDELYADAAAVAAHGATAHFKYYLAGIHELADQMTLLLDAIEVEDC